MSSTSAADPIDYREVDAFSFDCYGTLIDWESGILEGLAPWMARARIASGEAVLEAFAEVESDNEAATPSAPYPEILRASLRDLGRVFGPAPTAGELASFGDSVANWPAFPDSAAALAELGRGAQLIVVSNVDAGSFAHSSARLGDPFDHRILASDVGAYKPSDAHFEALFALLDEQGIRRDRLVHVAQSLFHDHVPAARHGLRSVWIDRRQGRPGTGATAAVIGEVRPTATYPSMAAFAAAVTAARQR